MGPLAVHACLEPGVAARSRSARASARKRGAERARFGGRHERFFYHARGKPERGDLSARRSYTARAVTIRLYNTLTQSSSPSSRSSRAKPRLRLRPDDLRPRARRPRADVHDVRRPRPAPPRARLRGDLRAQRDRRRRQDPRARERAERRAPLALSSSMSDLVRRAAPDARLRRTDARAARLAAPSPRSSRSSRSSSPRGTPTSSPTAKGQDVYFAVRSFAEYGKLSHRNVDDLRAGARVEVGEAKRDPLDFALWKGETEDAGGGPARGGRGAPGGTSSARRWRRSASGRTSTSTAAGWTSSSPTTRTRSRRARPRGAARSRASGCTRASSTSTKRR